MAYLAFQVGLPLRYYASDDAFDERFAWRMFSPIRMIDCQVAFFHEQDGSRTRLNLSRHLADAWVGLMRRSRLAVVERYAEQRCTELRRVDPKAALFVELRCTQPSGAEYFPIPPTRNLCEAP